MSRCTCARLLAARTHCVPRCHVCARSSRMHAPNMRTHTRILAGMSRRCQGPWWWQSTCLVSVGVLSVLQGAREFHHRHRALLCTSRVELRGHAVHGLHEGRVLKLFFIAAPATSPHAHTHTHMRGRARTHAPGSRLSKKQRVPFACKMTLAI